VTSGRLRFEELEERRELSLFEELLSLLSSLL